MITPRTPLPGKTTLPNPAAIITNVKPGLVEFTFQNASRAILYSMPGFVIADESFTPATISKRGHFAWSSDMVPSFLILSGPGGQVRVNVPNQSGPFGARG